MGLGRQRDRRCLMVLPLPSWLCCHSSCPHAVDAAASAWGTRGSPFPFCPPIVEGKKEKDGSKSPEGKRHPSLVFWWLYRTAYCKEDAMKSFIEKHTKNIIGVWSGWDRIVLRGTLRLVANLAGMYFEPRACRSPAWLARMVADSSTVVSGYGCVLMPTALTERKSLLGRKDFRKRAPVHILPSARPATASPACG
jgi:hypothetical protein